jgi:hypothetical protein
VVSKKMGFRGNKGYSVSPLVAIPSNIGLKSHVKTTNNPSKKTFAPSNRFDSMCHLEDYMEEESQFLFIVGISIQEKPSVQILL